MLPEPRMLYLHICGILYGGNEYHEGDKPVWTTSYAHRWMSTATDSVRLALACCFSAVCTYPEFRGRTSSLRMDQKWFI